MYECMDAPMYGSMDVWMYGCMDVWMYGRMYGRHAQIVDGVECEMLRSSSDDCRFVAVRI